MTPEREEYLDNLTELADMADEAGLDAEEAIITLAESPNVSAKRIDLLMGVARQFQDARADLGKVLEGFARDIEKANER